MAYTANDVLDMFKDSGADPHFESPGVQIIDRAQRIADELNSGTRDVDNLIGSLEGLRDRADAAGHLNQWDQTSGYQDAPPADGGGADGVVAGTVVSPGTVTTVPGTWGPNALTKTQRKNLLVELKSAFPWAWEIGFGDEIERLVKEGATNDQIVAHVRQTDGWAALFPGFYREDGSKRYSTEAQYLQQVADYRDVLKDYGAYDETQDSPQNYVAWMQYDIDPNELDQRFQTYKALERGSDELKEAFYVYGGLRVTTDDLYSALINGEARQRMTEEYEQRVSATPLTYELYITRATEIGNERLARQLARLEEQGVASAQAVTDLISSDPNVNRQFADILYMAGAATNTQGAPAGTPMSLNDLVTTYTYAMLASAATEQGLSLPTAERLEAYVQAGVTRARALQAYGTFSVAQHGLAGMASRANVQNIDQGLFEEASLLYRGEAMEAVNQATALEESLGRAGGGFNTQMEGERLVQRGRSRR